MFPFLHRVECLAHSAPLSRALLLPSQPIMSSSEDDFMSDKFLAEPTPKPSAQTYTQRRLAAAKRHAEAQPKPRAVREEEARRKALETSLFEREGQQGGGKAMGLMMKMGWTPGEGLGKQRDDERSDKTRARSPSADDDDDADKAPAAAAAAAAGIGAKRRKLSPPRATHRTEPLRISLWAGKSGVGAHQRSPSPENMSFLLRQSADPTSRRPGKELDDSAEAFRRRRAQVDDAKRIEAREWAARTLHMEFEQAKGTTFHPLWIMPCSPLTTLPRPLIRLIDPELADSLPADAPDALQIRPGSPRANVSAADRMREEMRRDALVELDEEAEEPKPEMAKKEETEEGEADVDWASFIPSVHRVLRMDVSCAFGTLAGRTITDRSPDSFPRPFSLARCAYARPTHTPLGSRSPSITSLPLHCTCFALAIARRTRQPPTHLSYLIDSLRIDHLYCFWCAARYGSVEEMDAPGGCPGTEEDDH